MTFISENNDLRYRESKSRIPCLSANPPGHINKNNSLPVSRIAKCNTICNASRGAELAEIFRPNRAGVAPIAVVFDHRTARHRCLYPGQSGAAVAARAGFVDYTIEPMGVLQ